mmetsp:Transcript_1702/g.5036  ORF Transcript_1702/g.5036 Transcript_1702/m.5036 type:complete len:105 (+) Transcript_1702:709-1023(+)
MAFDLKDRRHTLGELEQKITATVRYNYSPQKHSFDSGGGDEDEAKDSDRSERFASDAPDVGTPTTPPRARRAVAAAESPPPRPVGPPPPSGVRCGCFASPRKKG